MTPTELRSQSLEKRNEAVLRMRAHDHGLDEHTACTIVDTILEAAHLRAKATLMEFAQLLDVKLGTRGQP